MIRHDFHVSHDRFIELSPYLAATLLAATVSLVFLRAHLDIWRLSGIDDYLRVIAATCLTVPLAIWTLRLTIGLAGITLSLVLVQLLMTAAALVGARVAARLWFNEQSDAASGRQETVLLVGLNPLTSLFVQSVSALESLNVRVAGVLARPGRHSGRRLRSHPILGSPERIAETIVDLEVHGIAIDRILIIESGEKLTTRELSAIDAIATQRGIPVAPFARPAALMAASGFDARSGGRRSHEDSVRLSSGHAYFAIKRVLDVVVAATALVVLAPLIAAVALIAARDVGFPVLFWQQRPGRFGRPFRLYKFRTMAAPYDATGRRRSDPERLSPVGAFLRRTRLDELPQLWNILVGEMSLIGPRPLLPIDQSAEATARLAVRPGLTGWAQINGGRLVSADDKSALDIWYIHNACPRIDLEVVWRTVGTVLKGEQVNMEAVSDAVRFVASMVDNAADSRA